MLYLFPFDYPMFVLILMDFPLFLNMYAIKLLALEELNQRLVLSFSKLNRVLFRVVGAELFTCLAESTPICPVTWYEINYAKT